MSAATYIVGDVFEVMASMPDDSVDLVLTSPPFLALRSYLPADHPDKHKEIGSEPTPAEFIDTLLALTAEWGRLIAPHGSIAVELGDTYAGSGGAGGDYNPDGLREGQPAFKGSVSKNQAIQAARSSRPPRQDIGWPLDKSMCLIPHAYAMSLAYGRNILTGETSPAGTWRVRNVVAWCRPNPAVGALGDKFRPATSFMVIATKSRTRWFDLDAVRTEHVVDPLTRTTDNGRSPKRAEAGGDSGSWQTKGNPAGAPPLDHWWHDDHFEQDAWLVSTESYRGSHYATWPRKLLDRPILAMCPRHVCRTCGEPRRRITKDKAAFDVQPLLAAHIKERREALGFTSADLNEWFGYKEVAKNWERTDKHGASIPAAKDWPLLKERLGLSDEFDVVVLGDRKWTESTVEYEGLGSVRADKAERIHESPRPTFNAATRVAPDDWSDCGHDDYRRGIVLDPFGGSGTTAVVATAHGRDALLIDLDERNADLARERVGMFLTVEHHDGAAA